MITAFVDPPQDFTREGHERAVAEALALPDADPDKPEIVAATRANLRAFAGGGYLGAARSAELVAPMRAAFARLRAAKARPAGDPDREIAIADAARELARVMDDLPRTLPERRA